jgi:hypothetical protein
MSMHEFEDLVEASIRCLHESATRGLDHRSLFKALYAFQAEWDTGHTMRRVLPILVERRFLHAFALDLHPDHARLGKRLVDDGWIYERPGEAWKKGSNEVAAFVERGTMYVEAGSGLWRRMADAGFFPGESAPAKLPIERAAAIVVREAASSAQDWLVRDWMHYYFAREDKVSPPELALELAGYASRSGAFAEDDADARMAPSWFREAELSEPTAEEATFTATLSKALPSVRADDVAAVLDMMPRVVAALLRKKGVAHIPGVVALRAVIPPRPKPVKVFNPFTKQEQTIQGLEKPPELRAHIDLALVPLVSTPQKTRRV